MRRTALAAAALLSVAARSAPARAQNAPPRAAAPAAAPAATSAHHASPARIALVRGYAAFLAHNYPDALAAFREAQATPAEHLAATLAIGDTLAAQGDRDGALATYRDAALHPPAEATELDRLRAMQSLAVALETLGRWDEASAAWRDYTAFAESHAQATSAADGRARMEAIDRRAARERVDAQVRARIEQRRALNARGPQPAATP